MSKGTAERDPPMQLDAEEMRRLGYQAIDLLVSRLSPPDEGPVVPANRDDSVLPPGYQQFAEEGTEAAALMAEAVPAIFDQAMRLTHPRFLAYIPGPANYVSALGDLLASGHNVFAGTTPNNQGPYQIEQATVRWLADLAGLPPAAGGLFVSGGSVATLTALAAARRVRLDDQVENARVYQSDHTHSSVGRALHILGFKKQQTREIASGNDCRIDLDALRRTLAADLEKGIRPFCVVGNAGTTSSGAVDDLSGLAEICSEYNLWLHVDAAYGGGALLSEQRPRFAGIEHADSISIDPHKWLFQPYESACVLVRDPDWLTGTFGRMPAYMTDTASAQSQRNYRDMSPQVTRAFKAFKLWLSLKVFGQDEFRRGVERGLAAARYAQQRLEDGPQWQVVTPATLGIVTFNWCGLPLDAAQSDALVPQIVQRINRDGYAYLSSTELFGRRVLRICPIHPALTQADIDATLQAIDLAARELCESR